MRGTSPILAVVLVGVALLGAFAPAAAGEPALTFARPGERFADAYQFAQIEAVFPFVNDSKGTLNILGMSSNHPKAQARAEPAEVAAGERGLVRVRVQLDDALGMQDITVRVKTDAGEPVELHLRGFVQSVYSPEEVALDFGFYPSELGARREVIVSSTAVERLEILRREKPFEAIDLDWSERAGPLGESVLLRVAIAPSSHVGPIAGAFPLRTNVREQPWIVLRVKGVAHAEVRPSESPIRFDPVVAGEPLSRTVEFRHVAGEPIALAEASDLRGDRGVRVTAVACAAPAPSCLALRLERPTRRPATFSGRLRVVLADGVGKFTLRYRGTAVAPATPPAQPSGPHWLPDTPTPAIASRSLEQAAIGSGGAPVVRWSASNQGDLYGFVVYRARAPRGPFLRVAGILPVRPGEPDASYEWIDANAARDRIWYYAVDALGLDGRKRPASGIRPYAPAP